MHQLKLQRFLCQTFFFLCLTLPSLLLAQPYWQQQTDFTITVLLNDVKHTLDGQESIAYKNNSLDTLHFIWFHLWPNAFKNDKTAYSEQLVERLDNTAFYFSSPQDKGYINKLNFKVNGQSAKLEDHPLYIDVAKLVLPQPVAPGATVQITTPFHVQLPKNLSRGGHIDQSYQVTQWYPKPAVYDAQGWHPMPYLDQGEFYNEFGDYNISITLPKNYVVAATGQLTDESEKQFLNSRSQPVEIKAAPVKKDIFKRQPANNDKIIPPSEKETKTIHYTAHNVLDFAWFADKRFIVQHDTMGLPANPVIDAYTFILPEKKALWKNSLAQTKRAVRFYAQELGDYPYPAISIVCAPPTSYDGGMEYPNVTLINVKGPSEKDLDVTIAHEVGHNWLQAMLATNERDHPWMDEGMNTYYERKYTRRYYAPVVPTRKDFKGRPLSTDPGEVLLTFATDTKSDQPIETTSEAFTKMNYLAVAYTKAALWMEMLEKGLGPSTMQQLMQTYFANWKMKHPQPADFKQLVEQAGGKATDTLLNLMDKTGPLPDASTEKATKVSFLYPTLNSTTKSITVLPAFGINAYDKVQIGLVLHNYGVPVQPFHFAIAPLYATGSKQFNFIGNASYTIYRQKKVQAIIPAFSAARFSTADGVAENYEKLFRGFFKIAPSVTVVFRKRSPLSNITKWVQWKSYFINESSFDFKQRRAPQDTFEYYAVKGKSFHSSVHQFSAGIENKRSLYPYDAVAQIQKVGDLLRATVTGNYFFNYGKKQGVNIRFFGGKIFYTKTKTDKVRYDNYRYHFTMYGPNGEEDYTYSNPFIERNQNTNLAGRQIMIRDGGFKFRSDYSSERPGRSDNWLAALNFSFDIPSAVNPLALLPFEVPLKVFADVGTSADAWQENNPNPKFLYSMGFQLPILRFINLYAVILESKQFKEPNEINGMKWWQKRLTFSVDIQSIKPKIDGMNLW